MNLTTLCAQAVKLYQETLHQKRPADVAISAFLKAHPQIGPSERKFIVETVYDTLRHHLYLQTITQAAAKEIKLPTKFLDHAVVYLYLLTQYQTPAHDLTQIFGSLTTHSKQLFNKLQIFYQAHTELDFIHNQITRFSLRHSFPEWLTNALLPAYSLTDLAALFDSMNSTPPLTLRVNNYKITIGDLQARLLTEGIETTRGQLSPFALICREHHDIFKTDSFQQGLFEVQDEGSQLISILLNARPTAHVLDACAGAGGKTLHIAALMKGRGEVFAYDVNTRRLANINRRIQRAGLQNIRVLDRAESLQKFHQQQQGKLDAVLVDAPCSGSGTLRRAPDIKLKLTPEFIKEMNDKQRLIINTYAHYLKPGGRLLYATCSLLPAENQAIVAEFLNQHQDFQLKSISAAVAEMRVDFDISPLRELTRDQEFLQIHPHRHNTDSFFAAILEKRKE